MKKLTVNEQEELFAQDCKLINLRSVSYTHLMIDEDNRRRGGTV